MQQLTDDRGKAIDFQPKAVRVTQWNSLVSWRNFQDDLPTIEEIATVLFSAATSLVFINDYYKEDCYDKNCQYLVSLLQHPHWATQLKSLLLQMNGNFSTMKTATRASGTAELMTALNALSALQQLAVDVDFWLDDSGDLPALTVLAQLKVLVVKGGETNNEEFLFDSIGKQAASDNVDLQIHLENCTGYSLSAEHCNETLLRRLVRLDLTVEGFRSELFPRFSSLSSLTLKLLPEDGPFSTTSYGPLLAFLSQHSRQLLHLGLTLDLVDQLENFDPSSPQPSPRSLPQLTSVRALTLDLSIDDHASSQAEWLCLPWTLPNCQAIHLQNFACDRCRVELWKILRGDYYTEHSQPTNSATALQCLRELLSKLYPHFQLQQITLGKGEPHRTAAELFAEHHEQQ